MKKTIKKAEIRELCSSEKTVIIEMLQEQINLQKEEINRLKAKLKNLEGQISKNSKNSSKPPSSDINKPQKTTSSKKKSGKKPGGQPGHKGANLAMRKNPEHIIILAVNECNNCSNNLKNTKSSIERRQEFEIPKPKIIVTEYQSESKECKCCGYTTTACFPDGITHIAQYGVRAKSLMAYMNQYQFLPYDRESQFFEAVYGQKISPGTIVNAVNSLANRLTKLDEQIKDMLSKAPVVNCDETSMSISGKKHWLHTVGNESLAHYALHANRGSKATKEIDILPNFNGIMVHDHWKSYFVYDENIHALCNAHHLRELRFINEHHNMKWANKLSDLLIKINEHKQRHIKNGKDEFSTYLLDKYSAEYDEVLDKGRKEHARNSTKDSHNLLKRLKGYKKETVLFMYDFAVPFTNNTSEQDLRMSKIKQKISGCFRQMSGGAAFCKIRNLLTTSRKNNQNPFDMIQTAFKKIISLNDILSA